MEKTRIKKKAKPNVVVDPPLRKPNMRGAEQSGMDESFVRSFSRNLLERNGDNPLSKGIWALSRDPQEPDPAV